MIIPFLNSSLVGMTLPNREVKASTIELFRADASHVIEDCLRSIFNLKNQGHVRLPVEHRKLVTFDESPADMAVWMAVNLSAPSIPIKSLPDFKSSVTGVKMVKASRKPGLPFGPALRARPQYQSSGGSLHHGVRFRSGALDPKTLQTFELPYKESVRSDVS